ncbi:accessory Sec system protein translocase subunit SecY2 [Butyrivibrio sp. FCS006]|uniref:accessory Sec system protein translocase subunit SecY2 n=1 Tax=Butyrivibrio sp. FCS006 TaxID=1280684 RepID=UPI00041D0F6E|nr:accessory Sec system protein translocase subunit SecY2 [Butyrivibrio sp. FCS006]
MKRDKKNNNYNVLPGRFFYTLCIVCLYILGRKVPIPWVITSDVPTDSLFAYTESILGTDVSRGSIFSLGISPWITSMILMQILSSLFRGKDKIISKAFMRRITLIVTIFMSLIQAYSLMEKFTFREDIFPDIRMAEIATLITLMGGTFAVIVLGENVSEYGIAGTSALILVNILSTFMNNLISYLYEPQWTDVTKQTILLFGVAPVAYLIFIVFATALFERSELRIPIYRVMINNDLADDIYIAIKLNPAGTMPVMFAMTFFLIPHYIAELLLNIWPGQEVLVTISDTISMENYIGILFYLLMAIILNFAFSFILINPSELTKQFMESGDCIAGLRPGKETHKFINKNIRFCAVLSCIMQCTMVGIPLFMRAATGSDSKMFQMPVTMIILTGLMLNVFEEIRVYRNFRDYKVFL